MLPDVIDYSEPLKSLPPNTQSFQQVCYPISGSTFVSGSSIDVDLGNRGFLVPDSLMIRYKGTTANVAAAYMCGTPIYTPFLRLNTQINSTNTENLSNYNVLANFITNTNLNVAQKLGLQAAYGYGTDVDATTPITNEDVDGGYFGANGSNSVAGPLHCALSSCEKLIPLFALNNIRLTFTLDSLANMFSVLTPASTAAVPVAVALPTEFTISQFEVCYQCVDFGQEVQQMVMTQGEIRIKSQTFGTSIQNLASGSNGQNNLSYNLKYQSIKALFLNSGATTRTVSANGNLDSYDVSTAGDYQFAVNGLVYPQKVLSSKNNKSGILQMLREALGSIYDKNNNMSINTYEFDTAAVPNTLTTTAKAAKFWVGVSTDKLKLPYGGMFSGVPSSASPIGVQINLSAATTQAHNVMLIACADYIFKIDAMSRQVVIVS